MFTVFQTVLFVLTVITLMSQSKEEMETGADERQEPSDVETVNTRTQETLELLPSGRQPSESVADIIESEKPCESDDLESRFTGIENNEIAITDASSTEIYPFTDENYRALGEELYTEDCGGVYEHESGRIVYVYRIPPKRFLSSLFKGLIFLADGTLLKRMCEIHEGSRGQQTIWISKTRDGRYDARCSCSGAPRQTNGIGLRARKTSKTNCPAQVRAGKAKINCEEFWFTLKENISRVLNMAKRT